MTNLLENLTFGIESEFIRVSTRELVDHVRSNSTTQEGITTSEDYSRRFTIASKAHDCVVVKRGSCLLRLNSFFGLF